jgi:HD-like signal output (HDOD) protein
VFKVLELSGSTDTAASEIEQAITVDPGFSSKVLVLANSASYALPKKVTSIREAIMFLGFKAVRYLAMTVGVFDLFVGKTDKESLRRRTWWRHSVDAAVCCRWLAAQTKLAPPDEAYTCGLLHMIGRTLLDRFGDGDYDAATQLIEAGESDLRAEERVYGCNHVEVVVMAAHKWHFPESLISGVNYLTEPEPDDPHRFHRAITCLGSAIASYALTGRKDSEDTSFEEVPDWAISLLNLERSELPSVIERATSSIAENRPQV